MVKTSNVFIIKIAGACNLNCSYCYMYNMGDDTYKKRPKVMSKEIATATISRLREYLDLYDVPKVNLVLHGGEPLLAKKEWMKWFLAKIHKELGNNNREVSIGLQTNGVLLDEEWIELLSGFNVGLGISVDGTKEVHDKYRVDHAGRGTFDKVLEAIELMKSTYKKKWGILIVADPNQDPIEIFNYFYNLGIRKMDFLFPDYHYNNPPPFSQESLLNYYTKLFEHWYEMDDVEMDLRIFESIIQGIFGKSTGIDALGPKPLTEVVIESGGSIEPLDVLRTCENGFTDQGYNVLTHSLDDFRESEIFKLCLENQDYLPTKCKECEAYSICGGGYMPHRWQDGKFDRESIHCHTLLNLIRHIYNRVNADVTMASELVTT